MHAVRQLPTQSVLRVAVLAVVFNSKTMAIEPQWTLNKDLPGVPIYSHDVTTDECMFALVPYVPISASDCARRTKVTEFDGKWCDVKSRTVKDAKIIVYEIRPAHLDPEMLHGGAVWLDLGQTRLPPVEPAIAKLVGAYAHAVHRVELAQTAEPQGATAA